MALIQCPECGNFISDKAELCPHCGLPAAHFPAEQAGAPVPPEQKLDYQNIGNLLLSFDQDYTALFSAGRYISHRDAEKLRSTYGKYYCELKNKLIFQYVCNHASALRVDVDALKRFLSRMHTLSGDVTTHNTNYVNRALITEKTYFDNILKDIDPDITLDEEQRRAVITDDDYCLLVAGGGGGA